jgi:hypothetical protein
LAVNGNASGAIINPIAEALLTLQQADGHNAIVQLNCFGPQAPQIIGVQASGTAAVPGAIAGQPLLNIQARGHDGNAWTPGPVARINFAPVTSPWRIDDHSTQIIFATTPVGSTTLTPQGAFTGTGLVVGNPTPAASPAIGDINATRIMVNGVAVSAGGGLADAPSDGTSYSRQNAVWDNTPNFHATTINTNVTAAILNPIAGSLLTLQQADGASPVVQLNSFGAIAPQIIGQTASGSAGSLGAVAGQALLNIQARGYDGTGWTTGPTGRIWFQPITSPWTTADHSTHIVFSTTPIGSVAITQQAVITGTGLVVGTPSAQPTPQVGDINAQRIFINGAAVVAGGGGGGTPGGAAGNVQYNVAGTSFGGSTGATFSGTSLTALNLALGSDATGDMYYRNAAGNLTRLPAGTSGYLLQSAGAGTPPAWVSIATGGGTVSGGGAAPQLALYTGPNVVAPFTMSGDATISATGALSLTNVVAAATVSGITFNNRGLITAAVNQNYVTGGPYLPLAGGTISGSAPGQLIVNRNTAAMPPTPGAVPGLWINASDTDGQANLNLDSHGGAAVLFLRRANGTGLSPTAIASGDALGNISWRGYEGTTPAYTAANVGRFQLSALQAFTSVAQGTQLTVETVPLNSVALQVQATFGPGLTVGAPTAQAGPVVGDINAQRIFINGTAVTAGAGGGAPGGAASQAQYYATSSTFGGSSGLTLSATAVTGLNVGLDAPGDLYYRAAGGFTRLPIGTSGQLLNVTAGLLPAWATVATGTGTVSAGGAAGNIALYTAGAVVGPFVMSQDAAISATGAVTIQPGVVTYAKQQNVAASRLIGNATGSPGLHSEIILGTNLSFSGGNTLNAAGLTSVGLTVPAASLFAVTGSPLVANGSLALTTTGTSGGIPFFNTTGTVNTSGLLAAHGLTLGGGAGAAPYTIGLGTANQVLTSNGAGADPTWQTTTAGSGTVVASPQFQLPYYGSVGSVASVQGHPAMSVTAAGALTINANITPTIDDPIAGAMLTLQEVDGTSPVVQLNSFGVAPQIIGVQAGNTAGSPSAVGAVPLLNIQCRGYDGTAWSAGPTARIAFSPITNPWNNSPGDHSTQIIFSTTPIGSVTITQQAVIGGTGLVVGAPTAQPSPAVGDINCQRLFVGGALVTSAADAYAAVPAAGNTQATATPLSAGFNEITSGSGGVALPAAPAAPATLTCKIRNSLAVSVLAYPFNASGAMINTLGANAAITVPANTTAYFESGGTLKWFTIP